MKYLVARITKSRWNGQDRLVFHFLHLEWRDLITNHRHDGASDWLWANRKSHACRFETEEDALAAVLVLTDSTPAKLKVVREDEQPDNE